MMAAPQNLRNTPIILAVLLCTGLILGSLATDAGARDFKNCGTRAPFVNPTKARGVGCHKAHKVLHRWVHKSGSTCRADGSRCHVLGFSCRVPRAHNYSNLICHRGSAVIFQHLVY